MDMSTPQRRRENLLRRRKVLSPLSFDLKGMTPRLFFGELGAAAATFVLLVPQGMAYALLAGLPPTAGLYAACVAPLAYGLFGSSRQLSVGPVAMDSLLVAATLGAIVAPGGEQYLEAALTLALLVGALQVLMGVLRLGFLVTFLSHPVISGFTSAAAVLIGLSQVKHLFGIPLQSGPTLGGYLKQISNVDLSLVFEVTVVGALGLLVLWGAKKWLFKAAGPLLAIVVSSVVVHGLGWQDVVPLVGEVPRGLPDLRLDAISWSLVSALLPGALTLAILGYVESISIAKSYALRHKYSVSENRELLALGLSNLTSGSLGGYPVAGGFSRTAVADASGMKTQLSAIIAALLVLLSLFVLGPILSLIPAAALAAIITSSIAGLINYQEFKRLERVKPTDRLLLGLTFVSTLIWGLIQGVFIGVVASLAWHVVRTARPHLAVLGRVPGTSLFRNVRRHRGLRTYRGILMVRMDAAFYFGNVQFLKEALLDLEDEMSEPLVGLILDASSINDIDSSAEAALRQLNEEYLARGIPFYVTGLKGPVLDVLSRSGLAHELGNRGRCLSVHEALISLDAEPHQGTAEQPLSRELTAQIHGDALEEVDQENQSRGCSLL